MTEAVRSSQRSKRVAEFILLLAAAWCVMTVTHESGHILCGWAAGGTLREAAIAPWNLPHSHFDPDPLPLVTLWGGPILGVLVPLAIAIILRRGWCWFIAYFCLIANGSYLAIAWYTGERFLDTPKLLHHGAPPTTIAAYCVITILVGYWGFRKQCARVLSPSGEQSQSSGTTPIESAEMDHSR